MSLLERDQIGNAESNYQGHRSNCESSMGGAGTRSGWKRNGNLPWQQQVGVEAGWRQVRTGALVRLPLDAPWNRHLFLPAFGGYPRGGRSARPRGTPRRRGWGHRRERRRREEMDASIPSPMQGGRVARRWPRPCCGEELMRRRAPATGSERARRRHPLSHLCRPVCRVGPRHKSTSTI